MTAEEVIAEQIAILEAQRLRVVDSDPDLARDLADIIATVLESMEVKK